MSTDSGVSAEVLRIDTAVAALEIESAIRETVFKRLRRRGVVLGLSGGVDSSTTAALCARAVGPNRVLGLFLPERECSIDCARFGQAVAERFGISTRVEDITPILDGTGCYRRRDEAIRRLVPTYGDGYKCKLAISNVVEGAAYSIFSLVVQSPDGSVQQHRLTAEVYLCIVAAMNFKQRTRKMMEYYYADLMNYAVAGTPNLLEYDQGFFVKNGDGAADLKPIAHLYKSQVYQLAEYLDVPREVLSRPPSTDTYPMEQTQEEFFFSLPYDKMDLCLWARNHDMPPEALASAGMTAETARRAYRMIDAKRNATQYLRMPPLFVSDVDGTKGMDEHQRLGASLG